MSLMSDRRVSRRNIRLTNSMLLPFKSGRRSLYRLYKEERLMVRKRGGRKRALGTRAPMAVPQDRNLRSSVCIRRRIDMRQSGLSKLLAIELDALAFQHQTKTTIAEPPPLGRQLSQLPAKPLVARLRGGHAGERTALPHPHAGR